MLEKTNAASPFKCLGIKPVLPYYRGYHLSNHLSISITPTHVGLNTTARVHTTLNIIQYHRALCDYGVIPTAKELSAMMEMV